MPFENLVVIGASAGGVAALRTVVSGFPAGLPAAVLVVLHVPERSPSALAHILRRTSVLPVGDAEDGAVPRAGHVYVAPPGVHLLVRSGRIRLTHGPRENGLRPAIDPLFRSAAREAGGRSVGVVLSGNLDDGAAGLAAIVRAGGGAVVQDDAEYAGMPEAALALAPEAKACPADEIAHAIGQLLDRGDPDPLAEDPRPAEMNDRELDLAEIDAPELDREDRLGEPSGFICPDCDGMLYEIRDTTIPRYRCCVGHAWSAGSLTAQQDVRVENALWQAVRVLQEKAEMHDRLAELADRGNAVRTASYRRDAAAEARESARLVETMLRNGQSR